MLRIIDPTCRYSLLQPLNFLTKLLFGREKVCKVKKNNYFCPAFSNKCCCSSVVEHFLGKEEVTSSSLVNSSRELKRQRECHPFGVAFLIGIVRLCRRTLCHSNFQSAKRQGETARSLRSGVSQASSTAKLKEAV